MRTTVFRRISLMAAILFATGLVAEAQVSKFIKKAKETVTSKVEKAVDNTVGSVVGEDAGNISNSGLNVGGKPALSAVTNGKVYYVSLERGSARAEGTKDAPMRDEYVSLEGGWKDDFSERNPVKYITRIQPSVEQRGTIGQGLLMIEATSDRNSRIIIDGLFFDLGLVHEYAKADPTDERFGCPEGCETGRIMPVGNPPNKTTRLIGGKVAGKLIIRNCMFLNASFNAIIMTNMGGPARLTEV